MISTDRFSAARRALLAAAILVACGGSGSDSTGAPPGPADGGPSGAVIPDAGRPATGDGGSAGDDAAAPAPPGTPPPLPNVLPVTVNGSLCLARQYTNDNEPCTSVTVCQPGTHNCQTIDGILVDTGSTGLRLFASVVKVPLTPVPSGAGTLAECEAFSGGMSSWGSLARADVVLGGEPAVTTPVFLIDSQFAKPTGPCDPNQSTLDTTPEGSGFNGILGISHHAEDCGDACRTSANNGTYFSCTATACTPTATDVQLVNPVGLLPDDGNGEILTLPSVPAAGAASVTGALILGIGTRANNTPGSVVVLPTATFGTLFPDFRATPIMSGTIDSGSSKLYFPTVADVPRCDATKATGPLCPPSPKTLSATMVSGAVKSTITFTVDNATALTSSSNNVFPGYASAVDAKDPYFMWGLPFFLGRSVLVALDGKSTKLGPGPYWAY